MIKNLFFYNIITITLEGFFDFVICGIMNIYTQDVSTNGEVLGIILAYFDIYMSVIFVPLALLWILLTKYEKEIASK